MKKLLTVVFALAVLTAGVFAQDAADATAAETTAESTEAKITADALNFAKETTEFALDKTAEAMEGVDFPTGTWVDEKWNAEWVLDVAKVHHYDATTGELIYTFSKDTTESFKFVPSSEGLSLVFSCKETHRDYKITKPLDLGKDLKLSINPDWTDEDYNIVIKFKSLNVPNK